MNLEELKKNVPLIAARHFSEFSQGDYHELVRSMHASPSPSGNSSGISGISVSRTKRGKISIRHTVAKRPFKYILAGEIEKIVSTGVGQTAEIWNAFKEKGFIIAKDRLEAEKAYSQIKEVPWGL